MRTVAHIAVIVGTVSLSPVLALAADEGLRLKFVTSPQAPVAAPLPDASAPNLDTLRLALTALASPESAVIQSDANDLIALAMRYAHAEGVPRDQHKANQLFCMAAKYGHADGLFNLGWSYANGRGVARDDSVAAALFGMAAARGHDHAGQLLNMMPVKADARPPECVMPAALPLAALPRAPDTSPETQDSQQTIAPREIAELVQRLAPQFEIDANLVLAVIAVESAFNPQALSPAKAQGLMQLVPETAERFGVKRPFNPDENVRGGLAYLRWLLAYFKGDVPLVLAAYNAGEGAVEKYRGIPPYTETQDYVKKIIGIYRRLTHPYNAGVVAPSQMIEHMRRRM